MAYRRWNGGWVEHLPQRPPCGLHLPRGRVSKRLQPADETAVFSTSLICPRSIPSHLAYVSAHQEERKRRSEIGAKEEERRRKTARGPSTGWPLCPPRRSRPAPSEARPVPLRIAPWWSARPGRRLINHSQRRSGPLLSSPVHFIYLLLYSIIYMV